MRIGTRSYQKMESSANLTLDTILKIADGMGIAPDDLLLAALAPPRKSYPPHTASAGATLHDSSTAAAPAKPRHTRRDP